MKKFAQPMAAVDPSKRIFHTLDGLRGVAAVGVLVFHLHNFFTPIAVPGGYLAVDLFFMMSGVVLTHAYDSRFRAGMRSLEFMRARIIRLYPLYLLGTVLGVFVAVGSLLGRNSGNLDVSGLLWSGALAVLFLPNPFGELYPLNIPCWSLFFEICINFAFAVLWQALSVRRVAALCLTAGCALAFAIYHHGDIDQGSDMAGLLPGLVRTAFGFSIGILIARHLGLQPARQSNLEFLLVVALVVIAIAGWPSGKWRMLWDGTCVLLLFPLVVYWGVQIDPSPSLRRAATFLGLTSYAVYVLHSPVSACVNAAVSHGLLHVRAVAVAPYLGLTVLAILLPSCWIVDRYVDLPMRRRLQKLLPRVLISTGRA